MRVDGVVQRCRARSRSLPQSSKHLGTLSGLVDPFDQSYLGGMVGSAAGDKQVAPGYIDQR